MALARPYRVEYFRNRAGKAKLVKVGHAATITGALRAAVKTIQGDKSALWCQILNEYGVEKAYMEARPGARPRSTNFKILTY
jgi:hypothetical protein